MQANSKTNPSTPVAGAPEPRSAGTLLWAALCDWDRQGLWTTRRVRCALIVRKEPPSDGKR